MGRLRWFFPGVVVVAALVLLSGAGPDDSVTERLARHRNLGKAFYENPTTQKEAVEEFRKAFELAPNSARERLNYGLALLRAGRTPEGIAEIEKVQKQDPSIPHTWFNLGIQYKKAGDGERAGKQFERMVQLVPDEPVSHYNLGVLWKAAGRNEDAAKKFELASKLDPNLAAPHFQLFNILRQQGRREEAARRLELFQQAKKRQESSATPEDMEWSFWAEVYETIDAKASREDATAPGEMKFAARKLAGAMDAATAGLGVLDADADGRPDLLAWSATGARLYRRGTEPVADAALGALKGVVSAAAGDFNNDGWTDLCVLTLQGATLLANTKGRFQKRPLAAAEKGVFRRAVWLDYDRDYDLDLVLLGDKPALLRNQGAEGFADRTADFPFQAGQALDGVAFRLVADSKSIDLAVSYADREGVLYRDRLGASYEATPLAALPKGASGLLAADLDNNGAIDLAGHSAGLVDLLMNRGGAFRAVRTATPGAPALADVENRGILDLVAGNTVNRNLGEGRLGAGTIPAGFVRAVAWAEADFDLDGRVDLAAVTRDGGLHLLNNQFAAANRWTRVSLAGVKNAKLAHGSEVEVKAGSRYQKRIYQGLPLLFGLRGYAEADTIRITWPNGLIQNEPRQAAGKLLAYQEAQRLSGSCPMIWTWNGREFEFITDVLGVAPLGASAGDGRYFPVDHDEYVAIGGESLVARDGRYEVRITEELSEVAYVDQVQLIAVDHPADVEVLTNEKFVGPPFPEFRLHGVRERIHPASARDGAGRDVLDRLLARDRRYPDQFPRERSGAAALHTLTLDFGQVAWDNRAVLVLNGWVDWADGSTFLGRAQEAGAALRVPFLQVKDAEGNWRTVLEEMGMPAGKPKTIVVDLTGRFLTASREVRIVTNLSVYWDEIYLSEAAPPPPARLQPVESAAGDLRFRGFSRVRIHPERKQPEMFFYADPRPVSMWNPTPGMYTRYGEVRELVEAVDDRFVIMGSGDELILRFDASRLAPPPAGHRRDFLLKVDGWAKDRDPNTAWSQTVDPLPFHGMSGYPYPAGERYPDDERRRQYRRNYNTRPALRLIRPLVDGG